MRIGEDPATPGDAREEYLAYFAARVDGVFSDFPDVAVQAGRELLDRVRQAS